MQLEAGLGMANSGTIAFSISTAVSWTNSGTQQFLLLVSFNCHFLSELIDLSGWIWVDNCKWPTIGDVTNWVTNWVNKGQPLWEYILFSLQTVIKFKSAATSQIYTLSVWLSELDLAKLEWAKLDLAKLELTKLELAKLG